jgi:hypothetical protein
MPVRSSNRLGTLTVAAAVLATACGETERTPKSGARHWSVDPRPAVEIGAGEGEDALYRVTAATRLRDGRIAVANAGSHQVKLFGTRGEHLASLGRRGSGPGEFQLPTWVGTHADTLLVWDAALERLTVFDSAGRVARAVPVGSVGGSFPSVIGTFPDGTLLFASGTDADAGAREGPWRGTRHLVRVSSTGQVIDTLASVPSQDRYSYRSSGGAGLVVEDLPFGRRTVIALANGGVLVGTGEEYRIRMVDTTGAERELLRAEWTPRPVSPTDIQEYWTRMVTVGGRSDPAEAQAQRSRIPYPKTLPAYDALLVDSEGAVWIKDAQTPRGWDDPDLWRIFSADGVPLATMELPARVRPQVIGKDWILGTALDGAEREMVRLYPYRRG